LGDPVGGAVGGVKGQGEVVEVSHSQGHVARSRVSLNALAAESLKSRPSEPSHGSEQTRKLASHSPLDRVIVLDIEDARPLIGVVAARVDERGCGEQWDGKESANTHGGNGEGGCCKNTRWVVVSNCGS